MRKYTVAAVRYLLSSDEHTPQSGQRLLCELSTTEQKAWASEYFSLEKALSALRCSSLKKSKALRSGRSSSVRNYECEDREISLWTEENPQGVKPHFQLFLRIHEPIPARAYGSDNPVLLHTNGKHRIGVFCLNGLEEIGLVYGDDEDKFIAVLNRRDQTYELTYEEETPEDARKLQRELRSLSGVYLENPAGSKFVYCVVPVSGFDEARKRLKECGHSLVIHAGLTT